MITQSDRDLFSRSEKGALAILTVGLLKELKRDEPESQMQLISFLYAIVGYGENLSTFVNSVPYDESQSILVLKHMSLNKRETLFELIIGYTTTGAMYATDDACLILYKTDNLGLNSVDILNKVPENRRLLFEELYSNTKDMYINKLKQF